MQLLDDHLPIHEPAASTVLPADAKNAQELEVAETNVVAMFKNKNSKDHMVIGITSKMSKKKVSVFHIGVGLNLVCTSLLAVKWRDCIHRIHPISLQSATTSLSAL